MVQEHHLKQEECDRARAFGKRLGYTVDLIAAKSTGLSEGTCGGVGLVARDVVGITRLDASSTGHLLEGGAPADERMAFWDVRAWIPSGFVAGAVYLETGDGPDVDDGNLDRLDKIGCTLRTLGRPFLLGGDWQRPAGTLPQGWLHAINGACLTPGRPTCLSFFAESEIDYFMVSPEFAAIGAEAMLDDKVEIQPHRCVKLTAPGKAPKLWKRTLSKAKAIPVDLPFGPAHPGLGCSALLEKVRGERCQAELPHRTRKVIDFLETEMLLERGLLRKQGL